MKRYVIHATVRYTLRNRKTGELDSGQSKPTIVVDAISEPAALVAARKKEMDRYSSDFWEVRSLTVSPELVNVITAVPKATA